jgi:hypothetical protein
MFERFSDEARHTVVRALVEARRLGHDRVGTEHTLIALAVAGGAAGEALVSAAVTVERARLAVAEVVGRGHGTLPWDDGPYTARARHAFELSRREAYEFGHHYISSGHLLLAVLQIGDGNAVRVLRHLGVDVEALRDGAEDGIATERPPAAPTERSTLLRHAATIAPSVTAPAVVPTGNGHGNGKGNGRGNGHNGDHDRYPELAEPVAVAAVPGSSGEAEGEGGVEEHRYLAPAPAAARWTPAPPLEDVGEFEDLVPPEPDEQPAAPVTPVVDDRRCSFCGRGLDDGDRFVAGAEAVICEACVRACARLVGVPEAVDDADQAPAAPEPAVDGPVPPDVSVGDVARAFTTVFAVDRPAAERAAHLEDGDALAPLLAWATERIAEPGAVRVDRLRFLDGDRALVDYTIELGDQAVARSGWARRHLSGWKVTRATYTTFLREAGLPPL